MADLYSRLTVQLLEALVAREGAPDGALGVGRPRLPRPSFHVARACTASSCCRRTGISSTWRARPGPAGHPALRRLRRTPVPILLDAGIDCLQPLEVKAGMDLLRIKREFGDRIALIGGMDERVLVTNDRARGRRPRSSASCRRRWPAAATSCRSTTVFHPSCIMRPTGFSSNAAFRLERTDPQRTELSSELLHEMSNVRQGLHFGRRAHLSPPGQGPHFSKRRTGRTCQRGSCSSWPELMPELHQGCLHLVLHGRSSKKTEGTTLKKVGDASGDALYELGQSKKAKSGKYGPAVQGISATLGVARDLRCLRRREMYPVKRTIFLIARSGVSDQLGRR